MEALSLAEVRVERQLVLGERTICWCWPIPSSDRPAASRVRSRPPLAPGVAVRAKPGRASAASLLKECTPASFPAASLPADDWCWASQLAGVQCRMEYGQTGVGGLSRAPLVIDWNPARRRSPAGWYPLTVAQNGNRRCRQARRPDSACRSATTNGSFIAASLPVASPAPCLDRQQLYETLIGRFMHGRCRAHHSGRAAFGAVSMSHDSGGTVLVRYGRIAEVAHFVSDAGVRLERERGSSFELTEASKSAACLKLARRRQMEGPQMDNRIRLQARLMKRGPMRTGNSAPASSVRPPSKTSDLPCPETRL